MDPEKYEKIMAELFELAAEASDCGDYELVRDYEAEMAELETKFAEILYPAPPADDFKQ